MNRNAEFCFSTFKFSGQSFVAASEFEIGRFRNDINEYDDDANDDDDINDNNSDDIYDNIDGNSNNIFQLRHEIKKHRNIFCLICEQ